MPEQAARTIAAVCCALVVLLTGCTTYKPADPHRARATPQPIPADAWPVLDTAPLVAVREATPDFIPEYEFIPGFPEADRDPRARQTLDRTGYLILHNEFSTGGLFRVYTDRGAEIDSLSSGWMPFSFPTEPNASFLSPPGYAYETAKERTQAAIRTYKDTDMTPYFIKGLRRASFDKKQIALEGTLEIQLPEPDPSSRGILVHLPGLTWSEQESDLVDTLRRHRWSVATIETNPWVTDPNGAERAAAAARRMEWVKRKREAYEAQRGENSFSENPSDRQTADMKLWFSTDMKLWFEQSYEEFPEPVSGFALTPSTDPAALGKLIARAVDEAMAVHAYAAEAVVAYLDSRDPTLAKKPIVVVGLSAGALIAPTVAARLRELHGQRVAAIVDIAGGADLFAISRGSSLTDGGIELAPRAGPQPPPERIEMVHNAYIDHAELDPRDTAAALRDIPVLVVAARRDSVIPFDSARRLIERFDHPDRIITIGGHRAVFWLLPRMAPRIARWLDEHTSPTISP